MKQCVKASSDAREIFLSDAMPLGENLKKQREKAGLSQPELSDKSGVPVGTIRGIEQGRRPDPQWSTVQALAAALGITCHDLADQPESQKQAGRKKRK